MAEGIPAIIDVAIINDNPLPIPLLVTCSPSHITKKVPAVKVSIVKMKNSSYIDYNDYPHWDLLTEKIIKI